MNTTFGSLVLVVGSLLLQIVGQCMVGPHLRRKLRSELKIFYRYFYSRIFSNISNYSYISISSFCYVGNICGCSRTFANILEHRELFKSEEWSAHVEEQYILVLYGLHNLNMIIFYHCILLYSIFTYIFKFLYHYIRSFVLFFFDFLRFSRLLLHFRSYFLYYCVCCCFYL